MARQLREKVCDKCYACVHSGCKQVEPLDYCENFKKGYSKSEYKQFIREQNLNLKKICDRHNLSYNYLMKMLNGKINFSYRYRVMLDSVIFEKEEYLPYIDKFENQKDVANG